MRILLVALVSAKFLVACTGLQTAVKLEDVKALPPERHTEPGETIKFSPPDADIKESLWVCSYVDDEFQCVKWDNFMEALRPVVYPKIGDEVL